jgi:hypothetical protein
MKKIEEMKLAFGLRAMIAYEAITKKAYKSPSNIGEWLQLIYCMLYAAGEELTIDELLTWADSNPKGWLELQRRATAEIGRYNQFSELTAEEERPGDKKKDKRLTIAEIAGILIVEGGLDAHFVLDELEPWQVPELMKAVARSKHSGWEQSRFLLVGVRNCLGAKTKFSDFKFSWETAEELEQEKEVDVDRAAEMIRIANEKLKKNK